MNKKYLGIGITITAVLVTAVALWWDQDLKWKQKETDHFLLHYERGSFAQRNIDQLAFTYEGYYEEISELFGYRPPEKIKVFFHDECPINRRGREVWGYVDKYGNVNVAYASNGGDSSSHELRHYFHRAINPNAPYFFNEGTCGIDITIGGKNFFQLARESGTVNIPLQDNIENFGDHGRTGDYGAYSFCEFLLQQYGDDKFAQFYRNVTMENYRSELEKLSGLPFAELEQAWRDAVKQS
jgi:hypothetical protein